MVRRRVFGRSCQDGRSKLRAHGPTRDSGDDPGHPSPDLAPDDGAGPAGAARFDRGGRLGAPAGGLALRLRGRPWRGGLRRRRPGDRLGPVVAVRPGFRHGRHDHRLAAAAGEGHRPAADAMAVRPGRRPRAAAQRHPGGAATVPVRRVSRDRPDPPASGAGAAAAGRRRGRAGAADFGRGLAADPSPRSPGIRRGAVGGAGRSRHPFGRLWL